MSYNIKILFGKTEIQKYLSGIDLTVAEKQINLKSYFFTHLLEVKAFLEGITEAVGWTEYFLVESDELIEESILSISTREDFMTFYRNEDLLSLLTADDRIEIFSGILLGDSDFTKELLDQVLNDYGVNHLIIIDRRAKR